MHLFDVTRSLINFGVKYILVEKPCSISLNELNILMKLSKKINPRFFVAYNRRFYNSSIEAIKIINNDGGVLSFNFDFTEIVKKVEKLKLPKKVKENWFLCNSTHVVDLAFFYVVFRKINSFTDGSLKWHNSSSIFCGSGLTDRGALFSYNANWSSQEDGDCKF